MSDTKMTEEKIHSFVLNVVNMLLSMMDGTRTKRKEKQGGGKRQSFSKEGSVERKTETIDNFFWKNASKIDQLHKMDVKPTSPHDYSLWSLHVDRPFPSTASHHLASNWDMSDSDEYTTAIKEQFDVQQSVPQLYTIGELHYS